MEQAYRGADELDREIMKLMDKSFSDHEFNALVDDIAPTVHAKYEDGKQINVKAENASLTNRGQLRQIWRGDTGTISDHTAFHAIQTVNEWEQHLAGHDKGRDQRMMAKFIDRKFPFTKRAELLVRKEARVLVS